MPEDSRRHDHFCVITPLENFQVSPARQGRFDSYAHLARFERRRSDLLDANIFFAIKDGGSHPLVYDDKMDLAEVNFSAQPGSPAVIGSKQSGRLYDTLNCTQRF